MLGLAALSGQSYGQLLKIGVSFIGRNSDQPLGINDLAGVFAQADWNNLGNNLAGEASGNFSSGNFSNLTSGPLYFDDGLTGTKGTSAVTLTGTATDSWQSDGGTTTTNEKLMKGIIKENQFATPISITLSGLDPNKSYKFLAYTAENGAGAVGSYAIAGGGTYSTFYTTEVASFDGTFTLGNSVDSANPSPNSDYVQWDSVKPTASGTLTFTATHITGTDGLGVAGIQLLELAPPAGADKFWNAGSATATWDLLTSTWRATNTAGTSDSTFSANDKANFGDLGTAGARVVNVSGTVVAGETNVNNALGNPYTIQGGVIGGFGIFTKDGAGALTLSGANTFGGSFSLKHGTVNATTFGDSATAGNLGQGTILNLGDTTGTTDAKLIYGGVTATVIRALNVLSGGGEIAVSTAGANLTLNSDFTGSGTLTTSGLGALTLSGTGGAGFTGGLNVSGGGLTVAKLAVSTAGINVSGGSRFTYTGPTLNDTRPLIIGTGGATVSVSDVGARYRVASLNAAAGSLSVQGAGRLYVSGVANLPTLPTIAAGATLAIANEAGGNTLPASFSIPTGTLELAPGSFAAGTPITLNGGTVRLGHEGLLGNYYTGTFDNGVTQTALGGTVATINSYFAALTASTPNLRTNTNGRVDLNFDNNAGGNATPLFGDQGISDLVNIRSTYSGKILITTAGVTGFQTRSDDGSALYIDGQRVVNNNFFQGMTNASGTIDLTAGLHDIFIYYYQGGGGGGLDVYFSPVGGTANQIIPNSVLYAGDTFAAPTSNVSVTASSGLEVGSALANLGTLSQTGGTTFSLTGSANFASTTLTGAGAYGLNVVNVGGSANLGPITAPASPVLNKTGLGALIVSNTTPAGLTLNNNAGLVVIQGSEAGGTTVNPLSTATLNFNGGGLGLSATAGNPTYTTNLVAGTNSFRVAAGAFGGGLAASTITWAPLNNTAVIGTGATATFNVRDSAYTLNVAAPVSGAGALVVEDGTVNFQATVGNAGGLTVKAATVSVSGAVNAGSVSLTGDLNGVNNLNPLLTANTTLSATSINVSRGTLHVVGTTTNTGAFTQSAGTVNLDGNASHASVAVSGGTLTAGTNLTTSGALNVTGGAATVNGVTSAASITVNGTGDLTVKGNVSAPGGTTVTNTRSLTFNPGAGNTSTYTGGTVNVDNKSTIRAGSGITDLSAASIHVVTPLIESTTLNALKAVAINAVGLGVANGNAAGVNSTLAATPGFSTFLPNSNTATNNGGIEFPNAASDPIFNAFFGTTLNDAFTSYFIGNFTAKVAGVHNFRITDNDDNAIVVADTNFNGVFDSGDTLANLNCCGQDNNLNATLSAGQSMLVGYFLQDGGGGSGMKGYFSEPAGGTLLTSTIVRPGDAAQSGFWSTTATNNGGGKLQLDAGAEMRVKSFDNISTATLANGTTLRLSNGASAQASSAGTLGLSDAASSALVSLGDNHTLTLGRLTLTDGSTLTLDKTTGAATGGVVKLDGAVPGLVGITPSTLGTGNVIVQAGKLIVNSAVQGTGLITANGTGSVGGIGTVAGPVTVATGGSLEPGDGGIGLFTVGSVNFTGGTLKLDITDSLSYDVLRVATTGTVALGASLLQATFTNFALNIGDVIYIIDNQGTAPVTGTFNGIADQGTLTLNGKQFQISYDASLNSNFNTGGNDVALKFTANVPEPGSLVSLLSGLTVVAGLRRFRRRSL